MVNQVLIAPSILSANFQCLQAEVDSIASADWMQVDVMDGHFVPNLSFGAPVIRSIQTELLIDVHLMVSNPADRIAEFLEARARHITFHAEAVEGTINRKRLIETIRRGGATAGIAINPATSFEDVSDVLPSVDLLLIMSVVPGFGGQSFLPEVLGKVTAARAAFPDLMIQMDGGIDDRTAPQCIRAGASNLVSGSYIFRSADRAQAIASLRSL